MSEREFDLPVLLDGNVESIVEKLGDMTDAQLTELRKLEQGGKTRTTLFAAIDTEVERRRALSTEIPENGNRDGENVNPQGGEAGDGGERTYSQAEVDALLKERDADAAPSDKLYSQAELDAALEQAKADWHDAIGQLITSADDAGEIDPVELPEGQVAVRFLDADGKIIKDLPTLHFGSSDFDADGVNLKLNKPIEFPVGAPGTQVAGALLIGPGKQDLGEARLAIPFAVGGGREAKLTAGSLMFESEPPEDAGLAKVEVESA